MATSKPTVQEHLAAGLAALPADQLTSLAEGFDAWLTASGLTETPATMFFEDSGSEPTRPRRTVLRRR
jgi:hypothetical protein